MKPILFYLALLCCIVIFSCQKIEIPEEITSFYPESIDGVSYTDSSVYEVEKADGETFNIKLNFQGGSGYENLKIVNIGLNAQLSYHASKEVSEVFNVTSPEKGIQKGTILVSGQMNYSEYYSGATSDLNKFSFHFYLVDKMGVTRSVIIKFVKP